MSEDLREQLQAHLGNAFVIERELGGGGMSRVFVANEVRLSRKVVIKVLSPELVAGLNAERFEREILLAASLQQANIVGVLAAGEVNGLPYFTMPFVEGESLRAKLTGGGLPIADVIAILRDVAKALGYAHSRGIVHRDIKPDNVLLSAGTAMVTDFGIAKAISASRAEAGGTLTSVGTSIGTPAYMAPEQVAGDPNIDHRVDLYSLGCMTYELLTGRSPFGDRTPQRMLAAHLSETPTPVNVLRTDSPAPLNALVARLLQKDPDQRVQSASEVLQAIDALSTTSSSPTLALNAPGALPKVLGLYVVALGAVAILAKAAVVGIGLPEWVFPGAMSVMLLGLPALLFTAYAKRVARHSAFSTPTLTPGGSMIGRAPSGTMATIAMKASPHLSWRRTARGGIYAMGAFVVLVVAFMTMRALGIGPWGSLLASGKFGAEDRVVLADLKASPEDSALVPIVIEAVRAAMSQSNAVHLVPQTEIASALEQMKQAKDARLNEPAVVAQVAARTTAKGVLGGRLARAAPGAYAISLELTAAQGGAVLASYQATATTTDLVTVVDGLSRKLRGKVGESLKQVQRSIPLERATTGNLDALRKFSEATVANDIDLDYPRAVRLAREAVALDSTFALAWRKLAVALANLQAPLSARDSAMTQAARYADRLPDREKYVVLGTYYRDASTVADRGQAIAAYQKAYAADSTSLAATNQLGNNYVNRHQLDSAIRYRRRQYLLEPDLLAARNLVESLVADGQIAAAATIDSAIGIRQDPQSRLILLHTHLAMLGARGQRDSVRLVAEAMRQSAHAATQSRGRTTLLYDALRAGQLARAGALDSEIQAARTRDQGTRIVNLSTASVEILFRGRNTEGLRILEAGVNNPEWAAAAPVDRPYLSAVQLFARAGRPDRARAVLAQFMASDPRAKAPNQRENIARTLGEIALGEGKSDEAVRQFRLASVGPDGAPVACRACSYFDLARAFDKGGYADSAVAYLEKYLAIKPGERSVGLTPPDATLLANVEKRLGELYDTKNDKANAIKHYAAFVEQWKNSDTDLQPTVATVKKRLNELRGQEGK